jgi:hypothetical protein
MSITWQIELGRADGTKLRGIDAIAIQKEMSQKFDFFLFFFFFTAIVPKSNLSIQRVRQHLHMKTEESNLLNDILQGDDSRIESDNLC